MGCVGWVGREKDRIEERARERVGGCASSRVRVYARQRVDGWVGARKGWLDDLGFGLHTHRQGVGCFRVGCAVRTKHGVLANVS